MCLNGNTPYPTLQEAWNRCSGDAACKAITSFEGMFYLRREDDPNVANGGKTLQYVCTDGDCKDGATAYVTDNFQGHSIVLYPGEYNPQVMREWRSFATGKGILDSSCIGSLVVKAKCKAHLYADGKSIGILTSGRYALSNLLSKTKDSGGRKSPDAQCLVVMSINVLEETRGQDCNGDFEELIQPAVLQAKLQAVKDGLNDDAIEQFVEAKRAAEIDKQAKVVAQQKFSEVTKCGVGVSVAARVAENQEKHMREGLTHCADQHNHEPCGTILKKPAMQNADKISVIKTTGFKAGDDIRFGDDAVKIKSITGTHTIFLDARLTGSHVVGTHVKMYCDGCSFNCSKDKDNISEKWCDNKMEFCCEAESIGCKELKRQMKTDTLEDDSCGKTCMLNQTLSDSSAICESNGMRLCTANELKSNVCCGTGCMFDHYDVFASDGSLTTGCPRNRKQGSEGATVPGTGAVRCCHQDGKKM
jgi:hypothetical protein